MLGSGNPVGGANPAGVGQTLNYVGNLVYAYSGDVTLPGDLANEATMLSFTTGNEIMRGNITWGSDTVGGNDTRINVNMNSERIFICRYAAGDDESNDQPLDIIIPPFTKLEVKMAGEVAVVATLLFTGEIHA
tara:strand:- start:52 stop:450 length:399 start_codon:yes stop_codon:yes gene_type:complete